MAAAGFDVLSAADVSGGGAGGGGGGGGDDAANALEIGGGCRIGGGSKAGGMSGCWGKHCCGSIISLATTRPAPRLVHMNEEGGDYRQ